MEELGKVAEELRRKVAEEPWGERERSPAEREGEGLRSALLLRAAPPPPAAPLPPPV